MARRSPAPALILIVPLLAAHAAFAQAGRQIDSLPNHPPPPDDHGVGLMRLLLSGPTIIAVLAAVYALIVVFAVLIRREGRLAAMISDCAARFGNAGAGLPLWGLVALVLIVVIGGVLVRVKVVALLGIAIFLAGFALLALALASAALSIGARWAGSFGGAGESPTPRDLGRGVVLIAGAAAVPLLGWLAALLVLLTGLGAVLEYLVGGRNTASVIPTKEGSTFDG